MQSVAFLDMLPPRQDAPGTPMPAREMMIGRNRLPEASGLAAVGN